MNNYIQEGLAALGDPTRLAIFELLARGPQAVHQLAAGLPVSRPAVSQHLKVLKVARLVRDRRDGTRRMYELDPAGIALLRDHFAQLWDVALAAFKRSAEEEYKREKQHEARNRSNGQRKKDHPGKRTH
ncbi:MAG: metalloregulator ArsR/SmtB family transcription factor [Candidatus Acidiferrum sp.]